MHLLKASSQVFSSYVLFLGKPTLPLFTSFPASAGNMNLADKIGAHYFNFGIQLLVDDTGAQTSAIERSCLLVAEDINYKIFQKWLEGKGRQPVTWGTLVQVLDDIDLRTLAKQIKESFTSSSSQSGTF